MLENKKAPICYSIQIKLEAQLLISLFFKEKIVKEMLFAFS